MEKRYQSITEIENKLIDRISINSFKGLEWLYGFTSEFQTISYGMPSEATTWGLPGGKISIWSGSSGVGKSRLAVSVAKDLVRSGNKVLFFNTEATNLNVGDTTGLENLIICSSSSISEIVEIIKEVRPKVVFIDSVNEIDEFLTGNKRESRLLIEGENDNGLRNVANEINCHIILLAQVNQDGTIKGGTSLPHLVDIAFEVVLDKDKSLFTVKSGIKNRYGRNGEKFFSKFKHTSEGVEEVSYDYYSDEIWIKTHGYDEYHLGRYRGMELPDLVGEFIINPEYHVERQPIEIQNPIVQQVVQQPVQQQFISQPAPVVVNEWDTVLGIIMLTYLLHTNPLLTENTIRHNYHVNNELGKLTFFESVIRDKILEFIKMNNGVVTVEEARSFGNYVASNKQSIIDEENDKTIYRLLEERDAKKNTWFNAIKGVFRGR